MSLIHLLGKIAHSNTPQVRKGYGRSWTTVHCAYDNHLIRIPRTIITKEGEIKSFYRHATLPNGAYVNSEGKCYCSLDEWARLCFEE